MDKENQYKTCTIEIQKFFRTWWVNRLLQKKVAASSEEDGIQLPVVDEEADFQKCALKINVHMLLKWIGEEINLHENPARCSRSSKEKLEKIIFHVEHEEDFIHMVALTDEMRKIMRKNSPKPDLKKEMKEKEIFHSDDPYWPSRWILHIKWAGRPIPSKMWSLRRVERLDLSGDRRQNKVLDVLPHYVGLFKDLKYLNLEHNILTQLPSTLLLCQELKELRLMHNMFKTLPGFLLHLPKLEIISRHNNPFDYNLPDGIEKSTTPNVNLLENGQVFSCDTLCMISAKTVAKHMQVFTADDFEFLHIPKTLREKVYEVFQSVSYCNQCHKGVITKEGYIYSITMESLCGYNHIPITGLTCSHACAVSFSKKMKNINESILSKMGEEILCHDISVNDWIGDHSYKFDRRHKHNGIFFRIIRRVLSVFH